MTSHLGSDPDGTDRRPPSTDGKRCRDEQGLRGSISPQPLEQRFSSVFVKYAMRNAFDFALASVCVILDRDDDGHRINRCAIMLGAVAATPYRARDAEQVVAGNTLTDEVIHAAASRGIRPAATRCAHQNLQVTDAMNASRVPMKPSYSMFQENCLLRSQLKPNSRFHASLFFCCTV
jgi:hypothetical protein